MNSKYSANQSPQKFWESPIFWGILCSILVSAVGIFAALSNTCSTVAGGELVCVTKWKYLKDASPNELGDTLAGFSGAFAFIWIIVTVMLQSKELKAQRNELELARNEYQRMADAQKQQVALLRQQGEIFASEQRERQLLDVEKLFNARVRYLLKEISGFQLTKRTKSEVKQLGPTPSYKYQQTNSVDTNFIAFAQYVTGHRSVSSLSYKGRKSLTWIIDQLAEVTELRPDLSRSQSFRFDMLAISDTLVMLKSIAEKVGEQTQ